MILSARPEWSLPEIRAIRRLPKPHADLVVLAESSPHWWQLLQTAPVLAFMVARCWHFDGLPEEEAPARVPKYLLLRRTAICEVLGFPPREKTVRLLSKIDLYSSGNWISPLLFLRESLRWDSLAYDIFEKTARITEDEIDWLVGGTLPWIKEFLNWGGTNDLKWFFRMPTAKRHWIGCLFQKATTGLNETEAAFLEPPNAAVVFRSARKAIAYLEGYRLRRAAIAEAEVEVCRHVEPRFWPEPPIEPSGRILPVLSMEMLTSEGTLLRHCVSEYAARILRGTFYVYRVNASQRCTLGIRYDQGVWLLDELRAMNNDRVTDPAITKEVQAWLDSAPAEKRTVSPRSNYLLAVSERCGLRIRRVSKKSLRSRINDFEGDAHP